MRESHPPVHDRDEDGDGVAGADGSDASAEGRPFGRGSVPLAIRRMPHSRGFIIGSVLMSQRAPERTLGIWACGSWTDQARPCNAEAVLAGAALWPPCRAHTLAHRPPWRCGGLLAAERDSFACAIGQFDPVARGEPASVGLGRASSEPCMRATTANGIVLSRARATSLVTPPSRSNRHRARTP